MSRYITFTGTQAAGPAKASTSTAPTGATKPKEWRLPGPSGGVSIKVTYKPKGKVDSKEASGKDDGTTTWKGRQPREPEVEISWLYDLKATDEEEGGKVNQEVMDVLDVLTPASDEHPGDPWDFAESDSRAQKFARVKAVIIEEIELSPEDFEKGTRTAKFKMKSYSKKAQTGTGKDASKTPTAENGFAGASPSQLSAKANPPGKGSSYTNPPSAKP